MRLIDTHTHLDAFARRGELPAVLARARAAGLEAMIAIGTAPDDWTLYRDLAREHAGVVHYTVGLHPCSVEEDWQQAIGQMEGFWGGARPPGAPDDGTAGSAIPPDPVALGEIGLDRFHLPKDAAEAARSSAGSARRLRPAGARASGSACRSWSIRAGRSASAWR